LRPLAHDARLLIEGGRPVVEVNSLLHPWYRRYCIAHELGHLVVGKSSEQVGEGGLVADSEIESLCDRIARELIIPGRALRRFFRADGVSPAAVVEAAALFEVPVDIMAIRAFGDLNLYPSTFAVLVRRDVAESSFKGRVHLSSVRPRTDHLEPRPPFERIICESPVWEVLNRREACGEPKELTTRDDRQEYRISVVEFNLLRLAVPLPAEPGALVLICPVALPRIN
jgi:hypothetical protein